MARMLDEKAKEEKLFSEIIDLSAETRKRLIEAVLAYELFLANRDLVFSNPRNEK